MPLGAALALGAVFVVGVGATIGVIVAYAEIPAIFTTLAMGSIVYGIGRTFFFQIDVQNAPVGYSWFNFLGSGRVGGIPVIVVAFAAMALVMFAVLRETRFGRFVYATGDNPLAARITGIPTRVLTVAQYIASGLIAFFAGIVMAAAVSGMNTRIYNSTMIYDVLLVVVLGGIGLSGGRGGVRNVLVGTMLVGILLNGMTILDIGYTAQNLIKSVILLGAIIIDTFDQPARRADGTTRRHLTNERENKHADGKPTGRSEHATEDVFRARFGCGALMRGTRICARTSRRYRPRSGRPQRIPERGQGQKGDLHPDLDGLRHHRVLGCDLA